jgi:hypothetical protein
VTEVDQRARRLVIAYAILFDALEHPYPDERDCSPDLSDDHFDFLQLTVIGLAALSLLASFGVADRPLTGQYRLGIAGDFVPPLAICVTFNC